MSDGRHVLVTDAGRGSALACIRSLARRGYRVTAADHDPQSPGFRSRHASARLLYPDPRRDAEAMVERIHLAVRRGVDLVVPVTDETGLPLAAERARFEGHAVLALPDPAAMATTQDKVATVALAERLGVPIPRTRLVEDRLGAAAAADELGYPVVVKPGQSRAVTGDGAIERFVVTYSRDAAELAARLAAVSPEVPVLLQGWVAGEGLGVELLTDRGRPLAAFQHRRLREVPVTGGASSLRESVPLDADLLDHATRLLGALSWTGLAMVEFRRRPDGTAVLMEINGRIWGSLPLAVAAGMDFPARLAALMLDGVPDDAPCSTEYRVGVRARNLRLDLAWVRAVLTGRHRHPSLPWPPRRAAVSALASLLDPRIADDLFRWDDPAPGIAQIGAIVRDFTRGKDSSDA